MKDSAIVQIVRDYGYTPVIFLMCIGFLYQLNEERKEHLKELDYSRREYVQSMRDITKAIDGFNIRLYNIEKKLEE